MKELARRLKHVSRLIHLECRWKVIGELLLPEPDLPECFGYHRNGFCSGVKKQCGREPLCIRNDSRELAEQIRNRRGAFLHFCHAGACEMIIPIGENPESPVGIVMVGPFRLAGRTAACPEMEEEFRKLPLLQDENTEALSELIPELFTAVVMRTYQDPTRTLRQFPLDPRLLHILNELKSAPQKTIQELAESASLSPSRLLHLFRKECGVSLGEYLLRYRLWVARRYLQSDDWSICRIAMHMGFSDQSHFTMKFRRFFGVTPGRYRRKIRESRAIDDTVKKYRR